MSEKTAFEDFVDATWASASNTAFVGEGYVDATVCGRYREANPYLQFFLRVRGTKKRISRARAEELISKSADWHKRRILRRDTAACELAEQMAEKFTQSALGYGEGVAWPYLSDSEKDQWRDLARWTLDRTSHGINGTDNRHLSDCLFDLAKKTEEPQTARMLRKASRIISSTPTSQP